MASERRQAPRYDIDASVIIEAGERRSSKDTGEIVVCQSVDLSAQGMHIVLDQAIPVGRAVRVSLDIPRHEAIFVIAKTVWQRQVDTEYHHGLEIMRVSGSEFESWSRMVADIAIDNLELPSPGECR